MELSTGMRVGLALFLIFLVGWLTLYFLRQHYEKIGDDTFASLLGIWGTIISFFLFFLFGLILVMLLFAVLDDWFAERQRRRAQVATTTVTITSNVSNPLSDITNPFRCS